MDAINTRYVSPIPLTRLSAISAGLLLAGQLQAAAIGTGQLVVTEVMANPAAVSDSQGEWFELANIGSSAIELNGLVIRDDGSNSHTVSADTPLTLASGEVLVLGRSSDTATNGGYSADYRYSGFTLSNGADEIVLEWSGSEVFRLNYADNEAFGSAGRSMQLDTLATPIDEFSYSAAPITAVYGDGDSGTPGEHPLAVAEVPLPGAAWLFLSAACVAAGGRHRAR